MKRFPLCLTVFVLTIVGEALGGVPKPPLKRRERLWRLLHPPQFRTLLGSLRITVFHPDGERVWTLSVHADRFHGRFQARLPRPDHPFQFTTIIRPDGMWIFLPSKKKVLQYPSRTFPFWRELLGIRPGRLFLARRNYDLYFLGKETVAELPCLVLELVPKGKGNCKRRFWIHPPSRLPVRVERYDPEGNLELRVEFTRVRLNQPLPFGIFDLGPLEGWKVRKIPLRRRRLPLPQAQDILGFVPLLPTWKPPGYIFEGAFAIGVPRRQIAHFTYTDGIGVISVFEHPFTKRRRPRQSPMMMGRLIPHRIVVRRVGRLKVVLISDVSEEWLKRMAESLIRPVPLVEGQGVE